VGINIRKGIHNIKRKKRKKKREEMVAETKIKKYT